MHYTNPQAIYSYTTDNGEARTHVNFEQIQKDFKGNKIDWTQLSFNNVQVADYTQLILALKIAPKDYQKHYDNFNSYSYSFKGGSLVDLETLKSKYQLGDINGGDELTACKTSSLLVGCTTLKEQSKLKMALQTGSMDAVSHAQFSYRDQSNHLHYDVNFVEMYTDYHNGRITDDTPLTINSKNNFQGSVSALPGFKDYLSSIDQVTPKFIAEHRDQYRYRYDGQQADVSFDQLYEDYKAGKISLNTGINSNDDDDVDSVSDLSYCLQLDPDLARLYESMTYSYSAAGGRKSGVGLEQLHQDYSSGLIDDATNITGKRVEHSHGTLANFPVIANALTEKDELTFFDTDRSFPESNRMFSELINEKMISLIPWRSAFLTTEVKDLPLSPDLLLRLQNRDEDDLALSETLLNRYSPIRRFLPEDQTVLNALLEPIFMQDAYSLTKQRIPLQQEMAKLTAPNGTISDLRKYTLLNKEYKAITTSMMKKKFGINLADPARYGSIWEHLQEELISGGAWFKPYQIREDDTWKSIATSYQITEDELKKLNPLITDLHPGESLRVRPNLTAETSDFPSVELQRRKIAQQLFPNHSWGQYQALVERQERRTEYLNNYQRLMTLNVNNQTSYQDAITLIGEMEALINERSTPISQFRKANHFVPQLNLIRNILQNANAMVPGRADHIHLLLDELKAECQPTFFTMGKAMFPLVADVYEINSLLLNNPTWTGATIGDYMYPLEWSRDQGLQADPSTELHQRALLLQNLMQA